MPCVMRRCMPILVLVVGFVGVACLSKCSRSFLRTGHDPLHYPTPRPHRLGSREMDLGFGQWNSGNDDGEDMTSIPIGDAPEFSADFDVMPPYGDSSEDMQSIPILPVEPGESFSADFDIPAVENSNGSNTVGNNNEESKLTLNLSQLEDVQIDTNVELNKKFKSLSRRRKKPKVMFKKFLSILSIDANATAAKLIYKADLSSHEPVDGIKWVTTDGDVESDKPLSFNKDSFDPVVLKTLRYENLQMAVAQGKHPHDACLSVPLFYEAPSGERSLFGAVELIREPKSSSHAEQQEALTASTKSLSPKGSKTNYIFSPTEQNIVEGFCRIAQNMIWEAVTMLQQRIPKSNSFVSMFLPAQDKEESAPTASGKVSVTIKTLDFGIAKKNHPTKKKASTSIKKPGARTKKETSNIDLSFGAVTGSPRSAAESTSARPEDEGGTFAKIGLASIEEQARGVLLEAFDAVTQGTEWEDEEWSKIVLSPGQKVAPFKDPFSPAQRRKIEAVKTLPLPKLRHRKPVRSSLVMNVAKNSKSCRPTFKACLRDAMEETEYIEKKRKMFLANRKENQVRETFVVSKVPCRPPKENAMPRKPNLYSRELKVLNEKGVVSFIKEALKSNKSDFNREYETTKRILSDKRKYTNAHQQEHYNSPIKWRDNRAYLKILERNIRNTGRRRISHRQHTLEQVNNMYSPRRPARTKKPTEFSGRKHRHHNSPYRKPHTHYMKDHGDYRQENIGEYERGGVMTLDQFFAAPRQK